MYFKLCFYIANATNVFLSSILDIRRERGIPHQISPSTYHPWCYSVVSPVSRSFRLTQETLIPVCFNSHFSSKLNVQSTNVTISTWVIGGVRILLAG